MPEKKSPSSKHAMSPTRRDVLKAMGTGALLVAAEQVSTRSLFAASPAVAPAPGGIAPANSAPATPVLEPFALSDVELSDGPFVENQKRDEAYLLRLEADRMLHNFRVNAGLEPKAPVYGGWESVQGWASIRAHGHTLGHYLSAASMMFASAGNDEVKKRVDYIVGELKECQDAGKTGLVCAFPDNDAQIMNLVQRGRATGVPWYTMHKIFAGLRDAYLYCGSENARNVLIKLADWAVNVTSGMTGDQFERMLGVEHGGMNEVLADVYAMTGEEKYLTLAEHFCHQAILIPMSQGRDILDGLHSNTQIPKIVGFQRLYEITGKPVYRAAAEFFWKTVTHTRSFATGGNGDGEHFFPIGDFARHVSSAKTMETCCSYNMLKLTRILFLTDPASQYADYYERTLFNAILGSQDPDSGMVTYFQSTKPGYLKLFCTPFDSFWCCTGTGIENHSKYRDSIYFRGAPGGPQADTLFVNLFIPSTVHWKEKGVSIRQTTSFPESGKTRLEITADSPKELALQVRHPYWAPAVKITVNGTAADATGKPGSFIAVKRTWKTGDVVEMDMPMPIHTELLPGTTDTAAVMYGPLVLVGALGQEVKPGEDQVKSERTIGSVLNTQVDVPAFGGDIAGIPGKIKPGASPLTFKTDGLAHPQEVNLVPYFKMAHQRYTMYWKIESA